MTASGVLEPAHPALEHGAVVLTTRAGAERCHRQLPGAVEVIALGGDAAVEPVEAVAALRERGYRSICSEAGPHVFGSLLAAGLVDELYLTVSPLLAGRSELGRRLGLVEETELLPERQDQARLLSVRRVRRGSLPALWTDPRRVTVRVSRVAQLSRDRTHCSTATWLDPLQRRPGDA